MPTNISGTTGIDKVQDGTIVDADIDTVAASKLTGALPAISGANLTNVPAANITGTLPAISGANLTSVNAVNGGRKNILYNGAMKISQRGTSFAAIANAAYSLDRWKFYNNGIGAYTVTQDSDAPAGFANSYKIDCTTADASPAAGDYLIFRQILEGQDLQQLKKGTASAESVTLSFWVKCNKTGNAQVNLRDMDNDRIIGNTFTISSADTWEQKSITFAGDTTGAFNDDNADSLFISWWLDSGSTYTGGAVPTSWETRAQTDRNAGGTLALADSTSNYLKITGVQLELGSVATEFEHRSYGEELALCQRYYNCLADGAAGVLGLGVIRNTTQSTVFKYHPVEMRVNPTLVEHDTSNIYRQNGITNTNSDGTAPSLDQGNEQGTSFNCNGFSGLTNGQVTTTKITSGGKLGLDAEL